jgi:(p)ppGpp synthase/HD superfamily hydrolase
MSSDHTPAEPSEAETEVLVARWHAAQTDQGGQPYIAHLRAVRDLLGPDATDVQRKAALLHDAMEDQGIDAGRLGRLGFRPAIIAIIELLTHSARAKPDPHTTSVEERRRVKAAHYRADIQRIIDSGNVDAMRVKRADNTHNADVRRDVHLSEAQRLEAQWRREHCYLPSIALLTRAIEAAAS